MARFRANDDPFCVPSDMGHASAAAPTRGDAAIYAQDGSLGTLPPCGGAGRHMIALGATPPVSYHGP